MEAADLPSPPCHNVDPADPVAVDTAEPVAVGPAPPKHQRWSRAEDDRRNQRTVELLIQAADESLAEADRQHCVELAVEINLPMAEALARRYRSAGEDLDDLIQVARLGLLQAVKRFNPETGNFAAFAVPTITGEIKRHFRDHFWSTPRPPRRLQELHRQANDAWTDLAQETGHTPDTAELADRLDAHPDDVREAMATSPFVSTSLDTPATDTMSAASEWIGTPEPGFQAVEDALERIQLNKHLRRAIAQLSETDRLILHRRFGQNRKQIEIAAELGISQMSISRHLTKITQTLRDKLTADGVSPTSVN